MNILSKIWPLLVLIGAFLSLIVNHQLGLVFISGKLLWAIYLGSGFLLTFIFYNKIKPAVKMRPPLLQLFFVFLTGVIVFGGFVSFLFFQTNNYLAENPVVFQKCKIIRTGYFSVGRGGGCKAPYVEVELNGLKKKIPFPCRLSGKVEKYNSVKLDLRKGVFGFDFIVEKELTVE